MIYKTISIVDKFNTIIIFRNLVNKVLYLESGVIIIINNNFVKLQ